MGLEALVRLIGSGLSTLALPHTSEHASEWLMTWPIQLTRQTSLYTFLVQIVLFSGGWPHILFTRRTTGIDLEVCIYNMHYFVQSSVNMLSFCKNCHFWVLFLSENNGRCSIVSTILKRHINLPVISPKLELILLPIYNKTLLSCEVWKWV